MRKLTWVVLAVAVSVSVHTGCGSSTTPAAPTPTPEATPTPAPTPTPQPLSVIPPCPLPASKPTGPDCQDHPGRFTAAIFAAQGRVEKVRPDLLNFGDVNGGYAVRDVIAYQTAVVAALGEAGYCGKVDHEGEIAVKTSNDYNEQWLIVSHAGWGQPISKYVTHKYKGECVPSTF